MGEGVGGSPDRLTLAEVATVPTGGAPNNRDGGLEAVCRVSLGGEGDMGLSSDDRRGVTGMGLDMILEGMIGMGRKK